MKSGKEVMSKSLNQTFQLPIGTLDDARKLIGTKTGPTRSDVPMDLSTAMALCGIIEDPNPNYWHAAVSEEIWGARIVPPAMLKGAFCTLPWYPPGVPRAQRTMGAAIVPLPANTLINVGTEETFHRPIRAGDWLTLTEILESVSDEKQTALGPGYFITTKIEWHDETGALVAEGRNILLRYRVEEEADA
ncbi:MAG: hypothetical protein EOP62_04645 [Sphingomonadales bacterium]|nr:MAG: hypothetical protein EOP62_04645 [Sphingomonadales bacterium]